MFNQSVILSACLLLGAQAHASVAAPAAGSVAVAVTQVPAQVARGEKPALAQDQQIARNNWGSLFRAIRDYRNGRG